MQRFSKGKERQSFGTTRPTCFGCGGDNYQIATVKRGNKYITRRHRCLNRGRSAGVAWDSVRFLLAQFVRCSIDGPFNVNNPYATTCNSCAYEREEILNLLYHYGELKVQEWQRRRQKLIQQS